MLAQKRSRSKSRGIEEEPQKKLKTEEKTEKSDDYLIQKVFALDQAQKILCKICQNEISQNIKILCSVCDDFVFCIECFVNEKPHGPAKDSYKHDYYFVDKLNFNIFHEQWTAREELLLLNAIEKFGLDNWTDISDFMGTKSKLQCEAHYYTFYYKSLLDKSPDSNDFIIKRDLISNNNINGNNNKNIENNNFNNNFNTGRSLIEAIKITNEKKEREKIEEISKTQGKIPELSANKDNKNNRSRSLAKNRNKKDQTTITSAIEILGYWPKREEFDIEFLNDAELEIAELEFLDDDTENDRNLKLNVLKIYNAQLEEREKRKKFVISRGLLDVKKQMNFERRLSKEDREIYNCLKPFARFMSEIDFKELFEGIVLEKNLRQRLNQLKQYKAIGLKTYDDIEKHLETESRNKKDDKKNNFNLDYEAIGFKLNRFYDRQANSQNLESELEKVLVKDFGFSKSDFIDAKKVIIKELISEASDADKKEHLEKIFKDSNLPKDRCDLVIDYLINLKSR